MILLELLGWAAAFIYFFGIGFVLVTSNDLFEDVFPKDWVNWKKLVLVLIVAVLWPIAFVYYGAEWLFKK